jgi:4-amino-4-deoxy-L-arabinose transferase-like glycosyltransferase
MLHTVLAGCVVFLTGCGGFTACKIISALFYAAGIFPLTALAGRIFNRRVAMISGIIYCCASPLLPLGYSGLRDSLKSFLLLLLANALVRIYQERDHYCGYMYCGIVCGLAVLVRVEMIIFSLFPLWMMFFLECRRSRAALRSYLGCLLAVICVSPAFIQNYLQVGAVIPDSQSAEQFFKLTGHHASLGEVLSGGIIMVAVIHISALLLSLVRRRYLWYVGGALGGAAAGGFCYWLCNNKFSWPDGVGGYWFMVLRAVWPVTGLLYCRGSRSGSGGGNGVWKRPC